MIRIVIELSHWCDNPVGTPWMWTLAYGCHEVRSLTHGYEADREAAMKAFAKGWRWRQWSSRLESNQHLPI
jgi:hypothetical protein